VRAVCCPDKFRGSLTAIEAAARLAAGARAAGLDAHALPLADGGEGTLDVLLAAAGGRRERTAVTGPLGEPVVAEWGVLLDGTAVVEAARAAGLALVGGRNEPVSATTAGVGELLLAAARAGARRALVGVGGSATTDGGLGAVEALGWSLQGLEVVVACDVGTAFRDAAAVFGPQKGASAEEVGLLTGRLDALAVRYRERTGVDVSAFPGAGAAGGLAGGLAALGARLRSGFDVVAEAAGLAQAAAGADVLLTGEGKLDATSFRGKVVGGVLGLAAGRLRCGVICGEAAADAESWLPAGVLVESLLAHAASAAEAHERAAELVQELAHGLARRLAE
jgi:glycerate kinase